MNMQKIAKNTHLKNKKPHLKPKYRKNAKCLSWFQWATSIASIAKNGLHFTKDDFDRDRYIALQEIATQMITHQTHHQHPQIQTLFESDKAYVTPKIDVRGAIFEKDTVLLVKERSDGLWSLPGGWCDVNHSPAESAKKEILEEAGFVVKVTKLAAFYDKQQHDHPPQIPHAYKCFFLCDIESGEPTPSTETSEVRFFNVNHLPELSTHRITEKQIKRCFEHWQNPSMPTDFD